MGSKCASAGRFGKMCIRDSRMYAQGVEQINAQIERILRRYVKNGQISQAYALQLLSAGQTAQERERLLEQLQKTKEDVYKRQLSSRS